jgi:hypothetical protein
MAQKLGKISMMESEAEKKMAANGSMGESPAKGLGFKDTGSQERPMGASSKKAPSMKSPLGTGKRPMGAEAKKVPFRK